jgi:hypothetical protein
VEGLIKKDISVWPLADSQEIQYFPTVTRHEVEWFIREAINIGWSYAANGQSFVLQVSNEIFHPGFWASERATNPTVPKGSTNNEKRRTSRPS